MNIAFIYKYKKAYTFNQLFLFTYIQLYSYTVIQLYSYTVTRLYSYTVIQLFAFISSQLSVKHQKRFLVKPRSILFVITTIMMVKITEKYFRIPPWESSSAQMKNGPNILNRMNAKTFMIVVIYRVIKQNDY